MKCMQTCEESCTPFTHSSRRPSDSDVGLKLWPEKSPEGSTMHVVGLALTFLVAIIIIRLVQRYVQWLISPLNKLPGPRHPFFLGATLEISKQPFMVPHKAWWKETPDAPMIHYTTMFGAQNVLILDADIVKEILAAPAGREATRFPKRMVFIAKTLGNGLVSLEGRDWARHRRIIQPSFSTGALRQKLETSIPSIVGRFIDSWRQAEGRVIDVASHINVLALDIMGQVAFSHEFHGLDLLETWASNPSTSVNGQLADDLDDPLVTSISEMLQPDFVRFFMRQAGLGHLHHLMDPSMKASQRHLDFAIDSIIQNARKQTDAEGPKTTAKSLLQLLFDAEDRSEPGASNRTLSHEELRDEIKTMIIAGHETTATWIYWTLMVLAKQKDTQRRLYEEIVKYSSSTGPITLDGIEKMPYFNAFLREVLRLYPPVGQFFRYNAHDEVFAGYKIPRDTKIFISPHLLHRNPKYWKDPLEFRPERWLEKDKTKHHPFSFIPFSAGGRNCAGQQFAQLEAQLIVSSLIRSFHIDIAPEQAGIEFQFAAYITMKSKPDLKIIVRNRKE